MIEAPVTVPEASAFRPLAIIAAEAQCTVLRPLAIEAHITVPETSAFRTLVSTVPETIVIKPPIATAVDDCHSSNIWRTIGFPCRPRMGSWALQPCVLIGMWCTRQKDHILDGLSLVQTILRIAPYACKYVVISGSCGALWIRYYAGIWMRPVEAWWTCVPDAGMLAELDYASSGITECNIMMFTPKWAPRVKILWMVHTFARMAMR